MENHYEQTQNIFKTLVEESPSPVGLYVGPNQVIQLVNKAILKVWDRDASVIGKTFLEALPEMEGQPFVQILKNVYNTGQSYEAKAARVELFVDGRLQTFYFNFNYQAIKEPDGKVWAILNTADDVTELVLTRQKLAETEERTRFSLESAELGTWDLDPVKDVVVWDARCKELYGFSQNEDVVSYKYVLKYIHPDDRERIDKTVQQSLIPELGGFYESEFRTIGGQDGKLRWLRCRGKAYFNEEGRCTRFAGTALDITDEVLIREEQRKLITLIDHTSDFVSLSDVDGNVTYVNAAGREMLGLDSDAAIKRSSFDFIMPDELERVGKDVYPELSTTGNWQGKVNYRHFKTGEAIPVMGTAMVITDPLTGQPQGRATIARDMRAEIAGQKALLDSEQQLQTITSASPTALWMSDDRGMITYTNKTWADWTGQTYAETLGTGWLECILAEDRKRAGDKFLHDLAARVAYEVEFRIKRKNGDVRWCIATGNPQYNAEGVFTGYVGACTDITEITQKDIELQRKSTELQDRISEFDFVTDFLPVQFWTAKPTGELDYVNKPTVDYFGIPIEEVTGPSWLDNVHPDDRDGCIQRWTHSLQTGDPYQYEFRLRDRNGNYKWHLTRALPFMSDGVIAKWFGTNTDIDEQKQMQRQKDDFLGIASHELKTPVTSIKAYAQVLGAMLSKEGEDKKAAMVEKMDSQLNRLTNLIGDLLDVTKINSGRIQFNKTWFDFNAAVRENIQDLQHTTNRHVLVMDFKETGQIFSDKDRVGQVITNLVTNAIKYSPHTDRIIISTEKSGNEVTVCVQDFGIGIAEEKQRKVFEQFYRVSGSKQHTFPGLGLGLYISNEIIRREGGNMWVNSVEGKGSTFCFTLPVIQDVVTDPKQIN